MAILPSKLQLYLSHVRSLGHFIRSKRSKRINEIRKCDVNIVNDLIVTVTSMDTLCRNNIKMTSTIFNQSRPGQPRSNRSQLHAAMDLETFLAEDDKMIECPGRCVPRVVTGDCKYEARSPGARHSTDTGTRDTRANIIYVLVTRAGFKHQEHAASPVPCLLEC